MANIFSKKPRREGNLKGFLGKIADIILPGKSGLNVYEDSSQGGMGYGTDGDQKKASDILKQAEGLGVVNLPEGDENTLTYFDLKSQQMNEKQEIQALMSQGYSESDAVKIIGGELY